METIVNIGASSASANSADLTARSVSQSNVVQSVASDASSSDGSSILTRPPYISPAIRLDYETQQVVLEYRDSSTGEVTKQVPSGSQIDAYNRAEETTLSAIRENQTQVTGSSSDVQVQTSAEGFTSPEVNVDVSSDVNVQENRVQTSGSLGPEAPLNSGDTSSFA